MKKMNYSVGDKLKGQNDISVCEKINEYTEGNIDDIFNEISDSSVSVYTKDIFNNAYIFHAEGLYEQVASEGQSDDLEDTLKGCWNLYNQNLLENNRLEMLNNWTVEYLKMVEITLTEGQSKELIEILLDIDELEEIIELIDRVRLEKILDKETITFEELDEIIELEFIKGAINCGNSGQRSDCTLYTIYTIYGDEEEVLVK